MSQGSRAKRRTFHLRSAARAYLALAVILVPLVAVDLFALRRWPVQPDTIFHVLGPSLPLFVLGMGLRRGERWARWMGYRAALALVAVGFAGGLFGLVPPAHDAHGWLVFGGALMVGCFGAYAAWKLAAFGAPSGEDARCARRE